MEENIKAPRINNPKRKPLVSKHFTFMSFFDYTLTDNDREKAHRDFGETEENIKSGLLKLKEMLAKDKINYRMDDDYLLRYIRFRKYNYERAYKSIKNFYNSRKNYPEIFKVPHHLIPKLRNHYFTPLPYLDKERNPIYVTKFGNFNFEEISVKELLSLLFTCWNLWSMNPHAQINGVKLIMDVKGFTMTQASYFARHVRFIMPLLQELYPWRVTNLIIFNVSPFHRALIKFVCRFLRMKMFEKITILGSDVKELHEEVDPEVLTREYGGCLDTIDYDPVQYVMDNVEYLKYEHSFGYPLDK